MSLDDLNNNMTGLYAFIDTFRERIKPYAETIKIIEENAKKALEEFAEKMKPVHAFYILAEHQFTYWKPLCYDDIKQIIETQDVNTYLKERIEDKNFIDYDEVFEKMIQSALLSETTEPLPAKAGRFGVLLKQPKACTLKVIFLPLLLSLSQSYQSYSSPVGLDSEYTL